MKENQKACDHAFLTLPSSEGSSAFCGACVSASTMWKLHLVMAALVVCGVGMTGIDSLASGYESYYDVTEQDTSKWGNVSLGFGSYRSEYERSKSSGSIFAQVLFGSSISSLGGHTATLGTNCFTYEGGVGVGFNTKTEDYGVAIGYKANAYDSSVTGYRVAIGANSYTSDGYTIALGASTKAQASNAISIGYSATNSYSDSVALGYNSTTSESNTVSVGSFSIKRKIQNVANGVADSDAVTFAQIKTNAGNYIKASLSSSTTLNSAGTVGNNLAALDSAIGVVKTPTSGKLYVIGQSLNTNGTLRTSVAANLLALDQKIGEITTTYDGTTMKTVLNSKTISENLMALDKAVNSLSAQTVNLIKIGDDGSKIFVGSGSDASDATTIDVSRNTATRETATRTITGVTAGVNPTDAVNYSQIGQVTGTNVLDSTKNIAGNLDLIDAKIGKLDETKTYNVIAADGTISSNLEKLDAAIKRGGEGTGAGSTQTGDGADAGGQDSTAVGKDTSSGGTSSTAVGNGAKADGDRGTAVGNGAEAKGESSTAVGTGAKAEGDYSTTIGANSKTTGTYSTSVGPDNTVTGNYSGAFGNANNVSGDNSYAFGNHNTVSGNNTFTLGNNISTTANNSVVLGNGSEANEDNVVSVGAEGNERRIVNVADGVKDTDAVNMGQLRNTLSGNFNELQTDIRAVAAGSAALAALHPGTYNPDDKMSFAVGFGHYKDANAGALGAFYKPNEDTMISVAGTVGNGNPMWNLGLSFKLGERGLPDRKYVENSNVARVIDAQDKKIVAQEKKIAALEADNQRIKAQMAEILKKLELSSTVKKTAAAH